MSVRSSRSGFTLVEMAVVLAIAGLLTAGMLAMLKVQAKKSQMETTKKRLVEISSALAQYQTRHGRLPCPAALGAPPINPEFGVETAGCSTLPPNPNADPSAAPGTGGVKIRIGAVPVISLGLSSDHIIDSWQRRFVYAVSENLTVAGAPNVNIGAITLLDNNGTPLGPNPGQTPFVILSLGKTGAGGTTYEGVKYAVPCPATGPEHENCETPPNATFATKAYSESEDPAFRFNHVVLNTLDSNDPAAVCGNLGMIYGPSHPRHDSMGCVPNMVEAANGYVGIGTESPVGQLQINTTALDDTVLKLTANGTTNNYINYAAPNIGGQSNYPAFLRWTRDAGHGRMFSVYTSRDGVASNLALYANQDGNVGIGTAAPKRKFVIKDVSPLLGLETNDGLGWAVYSHQANDSFQINRYTDAGWTTGADYFSILPGGNVGIGATNPQQPLHLNSAAPDATRFRITNNPGSGGTWDIGVFGTTSPSPGSFAIADMNASAWRLSIAPNGNVGIGYNGSPAAAKLDVQGEVKIGNTGAACTAANEGAQRYNATIKNMEFCNGTAWKTMGGGGGYSGPLWSCSCAGYFNGTVLSPADQTGQAWCSTGTYWGYSLYKWTCTQVQ